MRVLSIGLHLMRTGEVQADLSVIGRQPYVPELIARKREAEHGSFPAGLRAAFERDVADLRDRLESARDSSALPDQPDPDAVEELHRLVVAARLGTV